MKWVSHLSQKRDLEQNLDEIFSVVLEQLGSDYADLMIVFVAPQYKSVYEVIPQAIQERLPTRHLVGCSARGVIGGGLEVENEAAISICAAVLPDVKIKTIYSDTDDLPDEDAPPDEWKKVLGLEDFEQPEFIILADPFTATTEPFLTGLDYAFPTSSKVGGLASGAGKAGENVFYQNDQAFNKGLVAVALEGNIHIDTIVSQGCRPVGKPLPITCCNQNLLLELGGQPPLEYLEELTLTLSDHDRRLMHTSLFLGVGMDPFRSEDDGGDFLIRNLIGVDYNTGALVVGSMLHEGQLVQFHLRDRRTSAEDLDILLTRYISHRTPHAPEGVLLFSCMGRGEYLYGLPNHDTDLFMSKVGELPVGGFFCNGEIGPVGENTYIHGYTSSFGIIKPGAPTPNIV